MEQILLALLKDASAFATPVTAALSLILAAFIYLRRVNIDERTTTSDIELRRIDSLMKQIDQLTRELDETRKQIIELHNQNVQLMVQLRDANAKISDLEVSIQEHLPRLK
jgi:TolA-binding protein